MSFGSDNARDDALSAELGAWCGSDRGPERQRVVIRLVPEADRAELVRRIEATGARVLSQVADVLGAEVDRPAARALSRLPGVAGIDLPRKYFLKSPE